jgi:hypothetical protein
MQMHWCVERTLRLRCIEVCRPATVFIGRSVDDGIYDSENFDALWAFQTIGLEVRVGAQRVP